MVLLIFLLCFFSVVVQGQTVPNGFRLEEIYRGLDPTTMTQAPDGRIFVLEKSGRIRTFRNDELQEDPFLTLEVDNANERGLSGIALDPDFEINNYVYIYYTVAGGGHNRVSRFKVNGDFVVPGSEEILLNIDPLPGFVHNAGGLIFREDKKLYVGIGDGGFSDYGQNLGNLLGKIIRINPDGSIPEDNPFYSELEGKNRAIYAYGFRNPFSLGLEKSSDRLFVNDVGQGSWEEVNEIAAGKNYGWPIVEGPLGEQAPPERYVDPFYTYSHSEGCAIVGGAFYSEDLFQFPNQYSGKYFFADYCGGYIKVLNAATGVVEEIFASGIDRPLELLTALDGSMYFLERSGEGGGSVGDNTSSGNGALWKVTYTGDGLPYVARQPSQVTSSIGEEATFSITASGSPILTYQWRKNEQPISEATSPSLVVDDVQLVDDSAAFDCVVSNDFGSVVSEKALLLVSSNTRPIPIILSPKLGDKYHAGDIIEFSGTASDIEDGELGEESLTWQIDFHHADHNHPAMESTQGIFGGFYEIPRIGETSSDVYYRIYLDAADSDGFIGSTYLDVYPEKSFITINTEPSGLTISFDGQLIQTPATIESVQGITRTIAALPSEDSTGGSFYLDAWEDGSKDVLRSFNTPGVDTTILINYTPTKVGSGNGLTGYYFSNQVGFEGEPKLIRTDSLIDFDWSDTTSPDPSISLDYFSIKWVGFVEPTVTGWHRFSTISDDGARLKVNNQILVDKWVNQGEREWSGNIELEAGVQYPIELEYFDAGSRAMVRLMWRNGLVSEVIPTSQLYTTRTDTSIDESEIEVSIYPNPVTEILTVKSEYFLKGLEILDLMGREVWQSFSAQSTSWLVDVSEFPSGVYFARISLENSAITRVFLVE